MRKNHLYELGKETVIDILLLASTSILLGMESNVRNSAIILSNKKQKNFELITEKNSRNIFYARWKWHLKDIFPIFFGRIKSEKIKLNY